MPQDISTAGNGSPGNESDYSVAEQWDPDGLRKRIFNNDDLFAALLNSFLGDSQKNATELLSSAESKELKRLKEVSHLLKGVCGQLCANRLHLICVEIEQVSLSPIETIDSSHLQKLCDDFMTELKAVEELFTKALNSDTAQQENNSAGAISNDEFLTEIRALQEKLEQSEYIDPDTLSPLKGAHPDNQALQDLVVRLIEEINLFDNEAASTTLSQIISTVSNT